MPKNHIFCDRSIERTVQISSAQSQKLSLKKTKLSFKKRCSQLIRKGMYLFLKQTMDNLSLGLVKTNIKWIESFYYHRGAEYALNLMFTMFRLTSL